MLRKMNGIVVASITCFMVSAGETRGAPIPCGAQLYLVRTLDFPGYQIGGIAWHQGQLWTIDQSGVLRRIDPISGDVLESQSTGASTHNGLGSEGGTLYLSYDPGGNTLSKAVLPPGDPCFTPTIGARDMTSQGGDLWYADFDAGKIVKMSATCGLLDEFNSPLGFGAQGVEWDGQHLLHTQHDGNNLYLIDPVSGDVDCTIDMSSFNPTAAGGLAWDGEFLYAADSERIHVIGVLTDEETRLFVANENVPNAIRELDPATSTFVRSYDNPAWTSAGAGRFLAFDDQGRLWVTNNNPWHVYAIGQNGVVVSDYAIMDPGSQVRDIEYSQASGMLYVVVSNGYRIIELNPGTGSQTTRINTGFEALGLGIAPNGDLYVTDYSGGARVYNPSTFTLIRTIAAPPGIVTPRSLAVAFVGSNFYLSSSRGDATASYIDEYRVSDGAYVRRVGTYGYIVSGLERASDTSLWAQGPFAGAGAVAEIAIASGEVVRILSQGGLSGAGNSDIELGRVCFEQGESLFDDFSYTDYQDPALDELGWTIRTGGGGPGPSCVQANPNCVNWDPELVGFLADDDDPENKLLRICAWAAGPESIPQQCEIATPRKFLEGTYAARVRFDDGPRDWGDSSVQAFYSISNSRPSLQRYSECDFEYLPYDTWADACDFSNNPFCIQGPLACGPGLYLSTWGSTPPEPPPTACGAINPFRQISRVGGSLMDWHVLLYTVNEGEVRYYVDGVEKSVHAGPSFAQYYPDTEMAIAFQSWFSGMGPEPQLRIHCTEVDWVYHGKGVVLITSEVEARVSAFRACGISRRDTISVAARIIGAASRKTHGTQGLQSISLNIGGQIQDGNVTSEPRNEGVSQLRISFDAAPTGPGTAPAVESQMGCPLGSQAAYTPYPASYSASIVGNQLMLTFDPPLDNARTYRFTSVAGQSIEIRGLKGDVNNDGLVNGADRSIVVGAWTGAGFSPSTDLNLNGLTNGTDRSIVVGAWTGTENCAP